MAESDHRICEKCGEAIQKKSYPRHKYARLRFCSRSCGRVGRPPHPLVDRFWKRVQKGNGCWLFLGGNSKGYGLIKDEGGRSKRASHVSWELHFGPIPPETPWVLHACDNPPCVRPDHLFLGTPLDNTQDMDSKGRRGHSSLTVPTLIRIEIYQRRTTGESTANLARIFNLGHSTVRAIVHRERLRTSPAMSPD